LYHKVLFH